MKRKIVEIALIIAFYLLQVTLGPKIKVAGVTPNFLIMLPILFGYIKGKKEGIFVGFFAGLMYDIFFTGLLGSSALIFVLIGFVNGIFSDQFEENNFVPPIISTAASLFIFEFIMFIGNFLLHNRLIGKAFIEKIIVPEMIYTILIVIAIYKPLCILNRRLDKKSGKVNAQDETII